MEASALGAKLGLNAGIGVVLACRTRSSRRRVCELAPEGNSTVCSKLKRLARLSVPRPRGGSQPGRGSARGALRPLGVNRVPRSFAPPGLPPCWPEGHYRTSKLDCVTSWARSRRVGDGERIVGRVAVPLILKAVCEQAGTFGAVKLGDEPKRHIGTR